MREKDPFILEEIRKIVDTIDNMRSSEGLSVYMLATEAEISDNTLKSILKMENGPSISTLARLSNHFGLALWELLLIADGEDRYRHQKTKEMIVLFENLHPKYRELLIHIAKELGK